MAEVEVTMRRVMKETVVGGKTGKQDRRKVEALHSSFTATATAQSARPTFDLRSGPS